MADDKKVITVNLSMFGQDAAAKTAAANKVAKELGISDEALAQVEDFKQQLTLHDAWDLPFMGYVNEDGYGYAYVPDAAICTVPYWDAHQAPSGRPLWCRHVPALSARHQRQVGGRRRQRVLISTPGAERAER